MQVELLPARLNNDNAGHGTRLAGVFIGGNEDGS